jgi:hypothetical protein
MYVYASIAVFLSILAVGSTDRHLYKVHPGEKPSCGSEPINTPGIAEEIT